MAQIASESRHPNLAVVARMALADVAFWLADFSLMSREQQALYRSYRPESHGQLVRELNHDPKGITKLYES